MKLISMTEFVLQQDKEHSIGLINYEYQKIRRYAEFLSQPLTLDMFVPCDLEGNILIEPVGIKCCDGFKYDCGCLGDLHYNPEQCINYKDACERVLFKGFEYVNSKDYWFNLSITIEDFSQEITFVIDEKIEDLLTFCVDFDWLLTESAITKIKGV